MGELRHQWGAHSAHQEVSQMASQAHIALQVRYLVFHVSPQVFPELWILCVSTRMTHPCPWNQVLVRIVKFLRITNQKNSTCPPRRIASGDVPAYNCVTAPYETGYTISSWMHGCGEVNINHSNDGLKVKTTYQYPPNQSSMVSQNPSFDTTSKRHDARQHCAQIYIHSNFDIPGFSEVETIPWSRYRRWSSFEKMMLPCLPASVSLATYMYQTVLSCSDHTTLLVSSLAALGYLWRYQNRVHRTNVHSMTYSRHARCRQERTVRWKTGRVKGAW